MSDPYGPRPVSAHQFNMAGNIDKAARAGQQTSEALARLVTASEQAERREAVMLWWTKASTMAALVAAALALASFVVAVVAL